jgi:hypothetical protein
MPTVLLPQRFGDQRLLLGVDLRSQLDHRGLDATRYEVGDLVPNGANSMRRCWVKTMSAFDAGYAEAMGMVMYTEADVVLMIRPLDRRSSGIIACTTCSGPQKLTSNARRYSVMLAASITPRAASTPRC